METRSVLIKAQLIAKRDSSAFVRIRGENGINGFKLYIPSKDVVKRADTIPVEWIRQQAEEFPGMESAMWGKLIRLWKTKIACEEVYVSSNHKNDVPDTNVGDTISRQQAIDAISCDITITGRRNAEIVSETIASFADRIKALPPAEPQIIHCKGCGHRDEFGCCKYWAGVTMGMTTTATDDDDFCSHAERIKTEVTE